MKPRRTQRGVALIVFTLLLVTGSAYYLLTALNKGRPALERAADDSGRLGEIREALMGHAVVNGCLPCPSTSATSGVAAASCTSATRAGFLPWQTLGLGQLDAWQHRYRYVVDPAFASGCSLTLTSAGDMQVQARNAGGALVPVATALPAVILSHGPNGLGARTGTGAALANPPASHIDENANRTATTAFVQRAPTADAAAPGGPFDDLVAWVPLSELIARIDRATPGGLPP